MILLVIAALPNPKGVANESGFADDRIVLGGEWFGGIDVNLPPPTVADLQAAEAGGVPLESPAEPVAASLHNPLGSIEAVICSYDWWGSCDRALRVAACESGPDYIDGNPYDTLVGTWQIEMSVHAAKFQGDPYDPAENARVAYEIYVNGGERHWPVCRYA